MGTPRLRGLLAISLSVAAAGAIVIVNTVVIVQGEFGMAERSTALALAAFGAGSMSGALALPSLLSHLSDRTTMLVSVALLSIGLFAGTWVSDFHTLIPLWFLLGIGYSCAQTPSGRLLTRSSRSEDRPALFAAHFALSHACWLVAYPFAGFLGSEFGVDAAFLSLGVLSGIGLLAGLVLWPSSDQESLLHHHVGLPSTDPHWREGVARGSGSHSHVFVIDDLHPRWPQ